MPKASSLLYKKGRPKITKKKNKMVSKAKGHGNAHIQRYHLDAMMSPIVSITKRDYGCDEVHNDNQVQAYELPYQGNLSAVMCQTGRQVYLEFIGLPLLEYKQRAVGEYRNTWSFMELLSMAFRRNNWLNTQTYAGLNTVQPNDTTIFGTNVLSTGEVVTDANAVGWISNSVTALQFARNPLNDTLINFNWCYMGGYQEHIFTNCSNAPVHLEFREYAPRMPLGWDKVRRIKYTADTSTLYTTGASGTGITQRGILATDIIVIVTAGNTNFGTNWTGAGTPPTGYRMKCVSAVAVNTTNTDRYYLVTSSNVTCNKYPLMSMTMFTDLARGLNSVDDGATLPAHMNSDLNDIGLFNEYDDKGFRYRKGVMVDTDYRFKVSEPKKKTIYPGEKYSYKMVFPPFTGNSLQFMQLMNRYASYISGSTSLSNFGVWPCVMPKFTKGLQVRAIGSTSYLKPVLHSDFQNRTYMYYDDNNDAPGSGGNFNPDPNFNVDRGVKAHATHPVRITHEVKEHHSLKTLPNYKSYHAFNTNYIANAGNTAQILPQDQMEILDPVQNGFENVAGDAQNPQ